VWQRSTKSSIAIESEPGYQVKDSIRDIDISIVDAYEATAGVQFEISDVMLLLHGAHAHALPMDASDPERCAVSTCTSNETDGERTKSFGPSSLYEVSN
jgi:hypothetical protein